VLTLGAWDGIYLAGGMVPLMLPSLRSGQFPRRFEDQGRFASAMQHVPTLAITYAYAGLLGAAATAMANTQNASPCHPSHRKKLRADRRRDWRGAWTGSLR